MTEEDRQLQPCLAELLRTCVKPASMVLHVDRIVSQETAVSANPSESSRAVTRFYLTDGELRIQALLKPSLLADCAVKVGDKIHLRDFVVSKAKRLNGSGKIIYLGIQQLDIVDQENSDHREQEGGFIKDDEVPLEPSPKRRKLDSSSSEATNVPGVIPSPPATMNRPRYRSKTQGSAIIQGKGHGRNDSIGSADDDFESVDVDLSSVRQRRQALRSLHQPVLSPGQSSETKEQGQPKASPKLSPQSAPPDLPPTIKANPIQSSTPKATTIEDRHTIPLSHELARPHASREPPTVHQTRPPSSPNLTPPFHTLASLLSPSLPTRNYPLSTLAIITYISPTLTSKPNSPFPPKRNIKLLDPTLPLAQYPQGFTLAVYVEARSFLPAPGTIALFRGIVMQKFRDEVILNAYGGLKEKPEEEKWFIDDERVLEGMGLDVMGLRRWWDEKVSSKREISLGSR